MWYDTDETPLPAGGSGHGTAHNAGGSDPITAISADIITTGTLADARLSANVALENVANVFSEDQQITKTVPRIGLMDLANPVDARHWRIVNNGNLSFLAVNDAATVLQTSALVLTRGGTVYAGGGITERGRTAPMGEWTVYTPTVTPNSGSLTGGSIDAHYMLIGNTLFVQLTLTSGSMTGNPTEVFVSLPGTFNVVCASAMRPSTVFSYFNNAESRWATCLCYAVPGESRFRLNHAGFLTALTHLWGTAIISV